MPTAHVNGVELYYELHGAPEGEVVVLSNGVLMSTASWGLQTPVLARHYRVLIYDCRGMWRSQHPEGPYTMEQHADDLAALLDALNIERAHLAGISYGGEVSMVFALRHPQRTRSLVVSSSVSHSDPVLRGMIDTWSAAARAGDARRLFEETYWLNFSAGYISANRAALEAAAVRYESLDMAAVLELFDCFNRLDIRADLHKIVTPTLVMVGEADILKPRRYSEIIAAEIPGAQLAIIPGAGHALCLEKPALFNALVLGFLAQLPAAASSG
ncbi:MAG TPA: alpha/beta fold hydrolase [Anaerolineaceae bacterium]|nr:alpha/beta fold hydrolase [Anaerolineaceae bacterium]HPN53226.1 alpha/beta fold hydrolase [Anaerolineaceae bacterium]